jgi:hypothetical protein
MTPFQPVCALLALALVLAGGITAQTNIHVSTFNAIADDNLDDARGIQDALHVAVHQTSGPVTVHFAPGVYRVNQQVGQDGNLVLSMFNLPPTLQLASSIHIAGNGARIEVVNETRRGLLLMRNMHDVTISNLDVDYVYHAIGNPPPVPRYADGTPSLFSQGKVTALYQQTQQLYALEIQLDPGFRPPLIASANESVLFAHYHDPTTSALRERVVNREFTAVVPIPGTAKYALHHPRFFAGNDAVRVGDIAVIPLNTNTSSSAFVTFRSQRITFDGINLFASPVLGFVEGECEDTEYLRIGIGPRRLLDGPPAPRPSTTPPNPAGPPNSHASTTRDGIHVRHPLGSVRVEGCQIDFTGDDGMNIHGQLLRVVQLNANGSIEVEVDVHRDEAVELIPGDLVRIIRANPAAPAVLDAAVLTASGWTLEPGNKASAVLTLSVSALAGDLIDVRKSSGIGSVVRGNRIRNASSRGIVFRGRQSTIAENDITNTFGAGIHLCSEVPSPSTPSLFEAGTLQGNLVQYNILTRCNVGMAPQAFLKGAINLTNEDHTVSIDSLHTDNEISYNQILASYGCNLYISNASRTLVKGNVFVQPFVNVDLVPAPAPFDVGKLVNLIHSNYTTFRENVVYDWLDAYGAFDPLLEHAAFNTTHVPLPLGFIQG